MHLGSSGNLEPFLKTVLLTQGGTGELAWDATATFVGFRTVKVRRMMIADIAEPMDSRLIGHHG